MPNDNSISTKLVGLGIPVGGLIGILTSFIAGVRLSQAFSFGVAGGIITATLIATIVQKKSVRVSILHLTSLGVGFGTLVGIGIGLLMGWIFDGSYISAFSTGAITGLLGGALLGILGGFLAKR